MLATPALAQINLTQASKGYTYFHRQGADLKALEAALSDCSAKATLAAPADPQPHFTYQVMNSSGQTVAIIPDLSPILVAPLAKAETAHGDAANIENCMVVAGWDVVLPDPKIGAALARQSSEEQRAALAAWVGAERPEGTVVRTFGNDLTRASTKYSGRGWGVETPSLSITAVSRMPDPVRRRVVRPDYFQLLKAGLMIAPSTSKALDGLKPDDTLIVVRMVAGPPSDFTGLVFSRADAGEYDLGMRFAVFAPPRSLWAKPAEEVLVFKVPAGIWRMDKLRSMLSMQSSVSLCLGSPGFSVQPGEVIFLGNLVMGGDGRFIPSMEMEPVRQSLSSQPDLAARLKPAAWLNGTTGNCGPESYLYALQIPGAPIAP